MVETNDPLSVTQDGSNILDRSYMESWYEGKP